MLVVGILAALVILLTQAFQSETHSILANAQAEKAGKPDQEKVVVVSAPSDAVTSSHAMETDGTAPSMIRELVPEEIQEKPTPAISKALMSDFLKALFRVFISPQAP